jgi:hypothetical protein
MKTDRKQKDKLTVKNPEKAWHVIEDLMLDDEELSDAGLDAVLKERGIDPDECINKIFQTAEKIARDPNQSGRVSPHVSDILSQLSQRHRSEKKAKATDGQLLKDNDNESTFAAGTPKAKAVKSFYRNFKNASDNDRQILASGEKLLEEKAKNLAQKKRTPK